jgi:dCMP deaminase
MNANESSRPTALIGWHAMFMGVAVLASARSKDHRTRNGACIATPEQRIIGVGYNGLPRGCDDGDPVYWSDDDGNAFNSRHSYVVHAEINAMLNCVVLPLRGATIYATQFPCPKCAQAIIQSGIAHVIYLREKPHHAAENAAARKMFDASGVTCEPMEAVDPAAFEWSARLVDSIGLGKAASSEADV